MRTEVLRLDHVSKKTPDGVVLSDVSFSVYKGTLHGILIQNDLSMACLQNILMGKDEMDSGSMYINDIAVSALTPMQSKKLGIFGIREKSYLIPGMSIAENFFLTDSRYYRSGFVNKKLMNNMAGHLLREVGLHTVSHDDIAQSVGLTDTHMIEIIGAISMGAKILLLDGITDKYSDREMARLIQFLLSLTETGISVLFFSKKYNAIFDNADQTTIIDNGSTVITLPRQKTTRGNVLRYYHFKDRPEQRPVGRFIADPVLEVKNLTLDGTFSGIDFTVRRGEVLGIWDEDWNYSRPLFDALFGLREYGGEILIDGSPVRPASHARAIPPGLAPIDETHNTSQVFQNMSLEDNVTILMNKPLYGRSGLMNKSVRSFMCRHTLSLLKCDGLYEKYHGSRMLPPLTRNDQLKLVMAKWLCLWPKVYIMLNPFSSFDDLTLHELFTLTECLCSQGIGLIIFSMSRSELSRLSDRILTLRNGRTEHITTH